MAAEDQKWTRSRRLTAGAWSRSEDPERNHGVIAGAFQIEDVVEAIRDDGQLVVSRDALAARLASDSTPAQDDRTTISRNPTMAVTLTQLDLT